MPRILKLVSQLSHSPIAHNEHGGKRNTSDRKLFSELLENPTHPLLIHIVPPFVDENHRMFHLQVSGEALWNWRDVCGPGTLFDLLQASILPLGYQLHDSACERVGDVVAPEALDDFVKRYKAARTAKNEKG